MSQRISLHIGLNHLSDEVWGPQQQLYGCHNDAQAMRAIAVTRAFEPQTLLDEQATIGGVTRAISSASARLRDGDYFFLTYSGHGGQVGDTNGDDADGLDETWCLFDGQLIDDDLYAYLCQFAQGVRVFILSDSCHSGTVTRNVVPKSTAATMPSPRVSEPIEKFLPFEVTEREYVDHRSAYMDFSHPEPSSQPAAKIILIPGCQDDQTSKDGQNNGAFTAAFLNTWNSGNFNRNFKTLVNRITPQLVSYTQTPRIYPLGTDFASMEEQVPLSDTSAPYE